MNSKAKGLLYLVLALSSLSAIVWVNESLAKGLTPADIEALRKQGEAEGWTFTVGENPATEYSLDELCGLVEPEGWWIDAHFDPCSPKKGLPPSFDWRDYDGCTPVKNQGGCGSCWAFATVGPLECNIKIRDGITVDLSEQWLVSCNRDGWGCGGGWWAHDYHQWKTDACGGTGAVLEAYFPYQASDLPCNCPYPHEYLIDDWTYIGSEYGIPPASAIKQAILDYGPVCVGVSVNAAFQAYTGGIFNGCANGDLNHGVVLVGWDDSQGPAGVWFMRNSWSAGWGEGGYMRIPYECSRIGYAASYVDYPTKLEVTVTSPEGGEIYLDEAAITWTATHSDPGQVPLLSVDLDYSRNEGNSWVCIDSNLTNDGLYLWDVSALPEGHKYLVRTSVTDTTGLSSADTCDGTFIISKLLPIPTWTEEGSQLAEAFGFSVSGAGDVNGDGYGDVIVGAVGYTNGQSQEGGAFLYTGGPLGLSAGPAWTAESDRSAAYFGSSVSWAGDVNGDGYSDVIVGAQGYADGESMEGAALLFLGNASGLSDSASWQREGNQSGAQFGFCVSGAGDVNGDGYSDVMVGAPYHDNLGVDKGTAYLFLGTAAGLSSSPSWAVAGDRNNAHFGFCVSGAGDVNGDGYSDVVVGAEAYTDEEITEGAAYLYLGGPSGLSITPAWIKEGNANYASFGWSVSSAGDVNGDGYSDVIVGAPGYDRGEDGEGRVFLYAGGPGGLSSSATWSAEGDQAFAKLGYSVASAGDVNGDGYSDVIVGAPGHAEDETDEGGAFLFLGSPNGILGHQAWSAEGDQAGAEFGYSVAGAGDVDGDGYGEVLAGSGLYDGSAVDEGIAYLFPGTNVPGMLPFKPRQLRADGSGLIGPLGISGVGTQARIRATGWYPDGGADVKLQWEIKPLGMNFDSTGLEESPDWALADSAYGVELEELVTGLTAETPYHWRARVLYEAGNPLGLDHGIWFSPPHNSWGETDFRTSGGAGSPPQPVDDLVAMIIDGAKSSSGNILLVWTEPYSESGVDYYVIYRSTAPETEGDSLATSSAAQYIDADVLGDVLTNHYYTIRVVDLEGRKSSSSNSVGEFERGLVIVE